METDPRVPPLAKELFEAYRSGSTIPIPSADCSLPIDLAYDVQEQIMKLKTEEINDPLVGYKLALADESSRKVMNADMPAYGHLTESNVFRPHAVVGISTTNRPFLEVEIVFKVVEELDYEQSEEEILERVLVGAGLEVPDSRYRNWFPNLDLFHFVCDSAAACRAVVGDMYSPEDVPDLMSAVLKQDGSVIAGPYAVVLKETPTKSLAWLVSALHARDQCLEPGNIVFTGSLIAPIAPEIGNYCAEIGTLAPIELSFVD